jgi:hypothetical protein
MDSPEPIERDIAFFAITGASVTFRKEACQCNLQSRRWLSLDAEVFKATTKFGIKLINVRQEALHGTLSLEIADQIIVGYKTQPKCSRRASTITNMTAITSFGEVDSIDRPFESRKSFPLFMTLQFYYAAFPSNGQLLRFRNHDRVLRLTWVAPNHLAVGTGVQCTVLEIN